MFTQEKPNYIAILALAVTIAGGLLLANQRIYGGGLPPVFKTDQMAPTVERLALLAAAPTPQATEAAPVQNYVAPVQDVTSGRLPLPRVFMLNDQLYTINIVDGQGMVQVGGIWYSCADQDWAGLTPAQMLNVVGLCDDQEAW